MAMLIRNQPRRVCCELKAGAMTADAEPVRSLERYLDLSRVCGECELGGSGRYGERYRDTGAGRLQLKCILAAFVHGA
jgi:hypothetical protein